MTRDYECEGVPVWVLIVKGWFFGWMVFLVPILLFMILGILFSDITSAPGEIVAGIFVLPLILLGQGLLIGLVVSLGLRVAGALGW